MKVQWNCGPSVGAASLRNLDSMKRSSIPPLTYAEKRRIRNQRQSIRKAFNHIKSKKLPISDAELINYKFQLEAIIDFTIDTKTAQAGRKVLGFVQR